VYRYVPRRNDAVNETWLCDEGRLSYKRIGADDRIDGHALNAAGGRRAQASLDAAVAAAAAALRAVIERKGPGAIGAIASPHATNEDLFVLRRFLEALGSSQAGFAVPTWRSDALLRKPEAAANAAGCRALGFGDAAPLLERVRGGAVAGLLVLGHDLLAAGDAALEALRSADALVLIDTHRSPLEGLASVVFAARVAAEKHGTLSNHAGRVQRVVPAVEPPFEAHAEGEIVWRLAQALDLPGFAGDYDVRAVSKDLAEAEPAFAGRDLDSLPPEGAPLRGAKVD